MIIATTSSPYIALKTRHQEAAKQLKLIAPSVCERVGVMKVAHTIARQLIISSQTVLNYMAGQCKDGFTTEAIID